MTVDRQGNELPEKLSTQALDVRLAQVAQWEIQT